LLDGAEIGVGEAEGAGGGVGESVALGGAAADGVVLHEHDPAAVAGVGEPGLVGERPDDVLTIDGRHRVNRQAGVAQGGGEVLTAKAAVNEELGARLGHLR
jgi:hypothetical protein